MGRALSWLSKLGVLVLFPLTWWGIIELRTPPDDDTAEPECTAVVRALPALHELGSSDVELRACRDGEAAVDQSEGRYLTREVAAGTVLAETDVSDTPQLAPAAGSVEFAVTLEGTAAVIVSSLDIGDVVRLCRLPPPAPDSATLPVSTTPNGNCSALDLEVVAVHRDEQPEASWAVLSVPSEQFSAVAPFVASRARSLALSGR